MKKIHCFLLMILALALSLVTPIDNYYSVSTIFFVLLILVFFYKKEDYIELPWYWWILCFIVLPILGPLIKNIF